LDFGCATGTLILNIAKHFPNAMVYGVDIEEITIAKAKENKKKENISNVAFVLSSGELMDKTWEKKFDWIIMIDVLHDLPNSDTCLVERES
jgi:ubiquinone/menaquinone biosynthesis C-methylase UbiE